MKISRLFNAALIMIALAATSSAYTYFYSALPAKPGDSWVQHGSATWDGYGYMPQPGSFIYTSSIGGANANDYEVKALLDIRSSDSGTLALIFRASSNSAPFQQWATTGTYIAAEVQNIQVSGSEL